MSVRDHLIQAWAMLNRRFSAVAIRVLRAVVLAGVVVAGALRLGLVRRVVVEGPSMLPTLAPGDRLLVVRVRRPAVGDVVALSDPRHPRRLLVKRVVSVGHDTVDVRGDNAAWSTDSASFGPVPIRSVRGRVVRRYAPAGHRGPVG